MTVALRGTTASGPNDGPSQSSSRATNVPTGSAAGDIAVLISEIWRNGTLPTVTFPAGFTQFFDQQITVPGNGVLYLRMAWKRLTGADTGTYTASYSATVWNLLHCVTVSGAASAGDPVEATNSATATSTTIPSTSLSTVTQPFLLHSVATFNDATQTPPTSYTEDQDGTVLHTNHRIPGTSGTHTASGGTISTSTQMVVGLVAIKADTGGAADLAPAAAGQAQTSDNVTLTQVHELAAAAAIQSQAADNVALAQVHELVVAAAVQGQSADGVTLTQVHVLAVDAAAQAQTATSLSLTQQHQLVVQVAVQVQAADQVDLGGVAALTVQDAAQAQQAGNVILTQVHQIAVADAVQAQTADQISLAPTLAVQAAIQAQAATSPTLTQQHQLAVADAAQPQFADAVVLAQVHILLVADAFQPQTAATVVLQVIGAFTPITDPVSSIRPNLATATPRANTAAAVIRANPAEASP